MPKLDPYPFNGSETGQLTQDFLWKALGSFFQPGDLVIGETGTSAFGIAASKLPKGAAMFNQTIFGSIGYATGAAVGAFQGLKEDGNYKRGILVTGEGSMHLTVQAFADMLRWELKPMM
jgi:pyruvate decarboxylase